MIFSRFFEISSWFFCNSCNAQQSTSLLIYWFKLGSSNEGENDNFEERYEVLFEVFKVAGWRLERKRGPDITLGRLIRKSNQNAQIFLKRFSPPGKYALTTHKTTGSKDMTTSNIKDWPNGRLHQVNFMSSIFLKVSWFSKFSLISESWYVSQYMYFFPPPLTGCIFSNSCTGRISSGR